MSDWLFYTTEGCHLCEQAWSLIEQAGIADRCTQVEISDSEHLVDQYGVRIPVLKDGSSASELGWPFDLQQLNQFISACEA